MMDSANEMLEKPYIPVDRKVVYASPASLRGKHRPLLRHTRYLLLSETTLEVQTSDPYLNVVNPNKVPTRLSHFYRIRRSISLTVCRSLETLESRAISSSASWIDQHSCKRISCTRVKRGWHRPRRFAPPGRGTRPAREIDGTRL